ncbi:hypothetical protein GGI03_004573 [Coemansia sp. RSA 2337]|nr:hypothetical protein H4S04_003238 [Coemansia sp. S16]KAJ2052243.1 hypothetical protein GGH13_008511 [Coemansia sp. S155-1]KAJ2345581.1 hypothetical protein GGH92_003986 [Coemansia sp. RSA 2673]KAJ2417698.1 hypothetical protein GGF41_005344 [Coemansia sp. RSA 2531]KAJ2462277.1 hypothetical protein GGI03_004573 [Coemansia sp. RSA 2337]
MQLFCLFAAVAGTAFAAESSKVRHGAPDYATTAPRSHSNVFVTVTAPPVIQQPPVIAAAAPTTVVQNAASVQPTTTVTRANGASSNVFSMAAAALAGTLAFAAYF